MNIASNRLSRKNIERIISPSVFITVDGKLEEVPNTSSPIDIQLYIELSKRQSAVGRVDDVYYKEFIEILGCSKDSFYKSLYRLEKLEYIRAVSDRKKHWDITLINNVFITEEDYKQGYMRTNVDFLYSEEFKSMSAVEKRICLYIHLNKNSGAKFEVYLYRLAKKIGIKVEAVIRKALSAVSNIFPNMVINAIQGEKIVFNGSNVSKNEETENSNFFRHRIKTFCLRHNIKHTDDALDDVSLLSGQYSGRISFNKFVRIMLHVIYNTTNRVLEPSFINNICNLEATRLESKDMPF